MGERDGVGVGVGGGGGRFIVFYEGSGVDWKSLPPTRVRERQTDRERDRWAGGRADVGDRWCWWWLWRWGGGWRGGGSQTERGTEKGGPLHWYCFLCRTPHIVGGFGLSPGGLGSDPRRSVTGCLYQDLVGPQIMLCLRSVPDQGAGTLNGGQSVPPAINKHDRFSS